MNIQKNIVIWVLLVLLVVGAYNMVQDFSGSQSPAHFSYSEFMGRLEAHQVTSATIKTDRIEGQFSDGTRFVTTKDPSSSNIAETLRGNGVRVDISSDDSQGRSFLASIFISWFPMLLLIGVWIFFMRQMQAGSGKAMGFGKSRAKLVMDKKNKITFNDVAGIEEAKDDLMEIVEFLKEPKKFQDIGGKIPRGCLLIGSPGTGKTLLARAIAGEADVPFFSISGSDFVEMFVGVGASRVRDMFEQGKRSSPCIIFIDEIDAVGRHRGIGLGGGNDEREQTLNQLLVEMDGFEENQSVIVIAATNRPDVLDPALLRPGRFDRQIIVPLPDITGREAILNVHLKKVKCAPDIEAKVIARGTPGFAGAELANIINEGALLAAKRNKRVVTMQELEDAKDKVMMGAERKSMVMSDEEKKLTAYHEGGHAIVTLYCPASHPIHKATIIPRGRALGMVMRLPEKDVHSQTREQLEADLAIAMGGRVAEEVIFGHNKVTSGASSDIQQATKIARAMVSEWGMSDKIGPLFHGNDHQDRYLLGSSAPSRPQSDKTADIIDSEVKKIVETAHQRATTIIKEHIEKLHSLAKALLHYETLTGDEIQKIADGESIREERGAKSTKKSSVKKSIIPTAGIHPPMGLSDESA